MRTYAPTGQTPVLRVPLSRDHLSVIAGLTLGGRLLVQMQERAYQGPDVVGYLQHLLRHVRGKLLVLWDGAPIHRCQAVKDLLAAGASARLHLEHLPAYAPELNPTEGVWHYLKHIELKNIVCRTLTDVRQHVRRAVDRVRQKARVIRGCLRQPGYL